LSGYTITTEGGNKSPNGSQIILLSDYETTPKVDDSVQTVSVTGKVPSTGLMYITIHLEYGLKGTMGWSKGTNDTAVNNSGYPPISSPQTYSLFSFANGDQYDMGPYTSINVFKKNPGIGGQSLQKLADGSQGDPLKGKKIEIYQGTGKSPVATVLTDEDGYYMWQFKWTGKAANFIVKMPEYNLSQSVMLKANGYLFVSFNVP
jgi:hypothetical protein